MPLNVFIDFIIYSCAVGWSPGPNNILLLGIAGKNGFKKTLPLLLGIWSGALCVMLLCGLCCTALEALIPNIQQYLKLICAGYMLWLAYSSIRRKPLSDKSTDNIPAFMTGFLLQLINAKIILLGISLYTAYIFPYNSSIMGRVCSAPLMIIGTSTGNLIWIFAGSLLNNIYHRHYRLINLIISLLLVWCAYKILFK